MRHKRGMNQKQVADRTGISRSSISKVESGDQPIRLWELVQAADLFDCRLFELLPITDDVNRIEPIEVELIVRRKASVHCIKHTV